MKLLQLPLDTSMSGGPCLRSQLSFYTCIHSLRMRMYSLPRCPEDHVAPRRLIISVQDQDPAVGKPLGAPRQRVFSSSVYWHQTVIFNSTWRTRVPLARRAFDDSVINQVSIGLLHRLKAGQMFGKPFVFSTQHNISGLLMLSLWKPLL